MIYVYSSVKANKAKALETSLSDFEYLVNYEPDTLERPVEATPDGKKPVPDNIKNNMPYFFSGTSIDGRRTKDSIKNKSLIILDIERPSEDSSPLACSEVLERVHEALHPVNYLLYPTINCQPNYARFRLIIEPDQAMNEAQSKAAFNLVAERLSLLDIPVDPSSCDFVRIHGLPVDNGLTSYRPIHNQGERFPIGELKLPPSNHTPYSAPTSGKEFYPKDEVQRIMAEYVGEYGNHLKDRPNYVAVKMQLIRSYQLGLIDYDSAIEAMKILAMGNPEWMEGNVREFDLEKNRKNIRTNHDIRTIVRVIGKNRPFLDVLGGALENELPKTLNEQYELLNVVGTSWREQHTKIINEGKSNERTEVAKMSYSVASRLLTTYATFVLIGDNPDKALLTFYNPDTGLYEHSDTQIHKLIRALDDRFTPRHWEELIKVIRTEAKLRPLTNDPDLIPVANGIYSIKRKQLIPFNSSYVFLSKIRTSYDANAEKPILNGFDIDQWFQSVACDDEEIVTLLWQVINEAINPNHTRGKMGFIIGDGNSGKGTFQRLLQNLIGLENIATLKPNQFGDRFSTSMLVGKVCNIGDDISNAYLDSVSDLMSIVTGDAITVEEKHKSIYAVSLKLFCLFSGNDMPNVRNKSNGWYRRLLLIPFKANFNGQKNDPRIKEKYLANEKLLQYVLKKALELDFTHFIEPKAVKEMVSDYKLENDYYHAFVHEVFIEENLTYFEKLPNSYIKDRLLEYMRENSIRHKLDYHFINPLIEAIEEEAGIRYTKEKAYYSNEYITTLPSSVSYKLKSGARYQSIVKTG